MNEEQKLAPYQRLKSILNDGQETLTDKASDNLDKLLGIEHKPTITDKITGLFKNIDSWIFNKRKNMYNTRYSRRRK